jgi:predicted DNA-binding transcriptional regulator YafY
MNILKQLFQLEQIDQLIRMKATGTPSQLASKLNLSERHIYRLINDLRDMGFPIEYHRFNGSYYYTKPVGVTISVTLQVAWSQYPNTIILVRGLTFPTLISYLRL